MPGGRSSRAISITGACCGGVRILVTISSWRGDGYVRGPSLRREAVEARAVVPEDLSTHLVPERQPEELLHRLGKSAVGVGIVGGHHEVVGPHLLHDIDRRFLVRVECD